MKNAIRYIHGISRACAAQVREALQVAACLLFVIMAVPCSIGLNICELAFDVARDCLVRKKEA